MHCPTGSLKAVFRAGKEGRRKPNASVLSLPPPGSVLMGTSRRIEPVGETLSGEKVDLTRPGTTPRAVGIKSGFKLGDGGGRGREARSGPGES